MAKFNYQLAWQTDYIDGHTNELKQSYGTLEKATEAMNELVWDADRMISRVAEIVYKPTGEILEHSVW